MQKKAYLLDLGYGNFPRLTSFLTYLGYDVKIKKLTNTIDESDLLVIPGIGNFNIVSNIKKNTGIASYIKSYKDHGNYILGICLGMQLLCENNEESNSNYKGLGVFPYSVKKLNKDDSFKVPRIGWYDSKLIMKEKFNKKLYYSHSYYVECKNHKHIKMTTNHNNTIIPAIIKMENIIGFQFHPELSGKNGIDIFKEMIR